MQNNNSQNGFFNPRQVPCRNKPPSEPPLLVKPYNTSWDWHYFCIKIPNLESLFAKDTFMPDPTPGEFIQAIQRERDNQDSRSILGAYETPLVTVDIVIFTVHEKKLKVLLIKRGNEPYIHQWALPGGFLHMGESLHEAAERRLREETNVEGVFLQQIRAFGQPDRDPRARVITIGFYALVSSDRLTLEAAANAEDVGWHAINEDIDLAFDHPTIINTALKTLNENLEDTPIAFQLLPNEFTLSELQHVYELIQQKELDKRNFRKKVLASKLVRETGNVRKDGRHRPAQLYKFTHQLTTEVY